ncbi:MAG: hypothetical protein K0R54_4705 [Clostridiaceae bacterium]|jgi:hypothetical protein|nr:hypothetical protein [Clostridiaceae bacterium]
MFIKANKIKVTYKKHKSFELSSKHGIAKLIPKDCILKI